MFKTATLFRVHQQPEVAASELEEALSDHVSNPLHSSESKRIGWTQPGGRKSKVLLHEIQGQRLMTATRQERLLPASVVNDEVDERCADIEAKDGQPPGRKARQEIKEQVYEELLPRAFIRSKKIDLWWDTRRELICVNASSRQLAEEVLDLLRQTLGSLKVTPLATQELPIRGMTRWLSEPETRPNWLTLGDQAQFKSQGDDASFTARQADLEGDEVRTMLETGRQATKVAVELDGQASFVLQEDFTFKSIRFADKLIEEASDIDDDGDAIARVEADFVLMAGALAEIIEQMLEALGGEAVATNEASSTEAGATVEQEALEPT